jgi:redox-sensitive bicupin YhaK (pirin superfamily)
MGYRALRVINEDRIEGGTGFGTHPHRDMEIISYVVSGALEHKDSMGNATVIEPDEVQRMSAGTGVRHSEYNKSPEIQAHFFQVWIQPRHPGGEPGYAQRSFAKELAGQEKVLVVSGDARDGSLGIQQDADLFLARLARGKKISHGLRDDRGLWLQVVKGSVHTTFGSESLALSAGDGLAIEREPKIEVGAREACEVMIFDLA